MPSRAGPYFFEEIGERTPGAVPLDPRGGKSFFPPHPFSPGWSRSGDLLLSAYLACGLHIERPVTARPPAGRAGDVEGYPLGEGREYTCGFPLFPPVNEPLLPPARAGGRAMRRWSWRPQARYAGRRKSLLLQRSREKGCGGKKLFPPRGSRGQSPLVFFPLFLQRNRAPAGKPKFPAVPTAMVKTQYNSIRQTRKYILTLSKHI